MSWRVIHAAVAGSAHARDLLPCQDYCLANLYPLANGEEALAIVVADGAGSAQFGGCGAQLACQSAQQDIANWLAACPEGRTAPALIIDWLARVREALQLAARRHEVPLREFACTLLLAVVMPQTAAYAHIGDGAIAIDTAAGLELVFRPENGEYANMTRFITDEDALEQVRITTHEIAPEEVVVFTDGIQRLALDFRTLAVHVPFFAPMLAVLRQQLPSGCEALNQQLAAFLGGSKINSRTDDDKTLVLATRR